MTDCKVKKALVVSGGLIANSIAARYLELVDRHGYSFSAAAWKLVEEGEDKRIALEVGQPIKARHKQTDKSSKKQRHKWAGGLR